MRDLVTDPRSFVGFLRRQVRGTRPENRNSPNTRRVEAAAGVEAQNAPTPAWKPQNGFHELPHASSSLSVNRRGSVLVAEGGQKILSLDMALTSLAWAASSR
jgi:hypothetical protein